MVTATGVDADRDGERRSTATPRPDRRHAVTGMHVAGVDDAAIPPRARRPSPAWARSRSSTSAPRPAAARPAPRVVGLQLASPRPPTACRPAPTIASAARGARRPGHPRRAARHADAHAEPTPTPTPTPTPRRDPRRAHEHATWARAHRRAGSSFPATSYSAMPRRRPLAAILARFPAPCSRSPAPTTTPTPSAPTAPTCPATSRRRRHLRQLRTPSSRPGRPITGVARHIGGNNIHLTTSRGTTSTTRTCRALPRGSRRADTWSPARRSATWATRARQGHAAAPALRDPPDRAGSTPRPTSTPGGRPAISWPWAASARQWPAPTRRPRPTPRDRAAAAAGRRRLRRAEGEHDGRHAQHAEKAEAGSPGRRRAPGAPTPPAPCSIKRLHVARAAPP